MVECYATVPDISCWIEFETVNSGGKKEDLPEMPTTLIDFSKSYQVGKNGNRPIDIINAPIRLITTRWIYDRNSRILFTSDMYSHIWQDDIDGPWVTGEDNVTTPDFVRSFLLNTRYWWLEGAATESIRTGIADVIKRCDIETIAPGYGTILRGREMAERQFSMLDDVLAGLDRGAVKPRYIPRGMER